MPRGKVRRDSKGHFAGSYSGSGGGSKKGAAGARARARGAGLGKGRRAARTGRGLSRSKLAVRGLRAHLATAPAGKMKAGYTMTTGKVSAPRKGLGGAPAVRVSFASGARSTFPSTGAQVRTHMGRFGGR